MKNIELSAPYFSNGLIKANLSWTINDENSIRQYDLSWIESQCHSDVSSCCYRRDAVTSRNLFQLYDLRFNCDYLISIKPIRYDSMTNKTFQLHLNVNSCSLTQVQGSIMPPCEKDRQKSMENDIDRSIIEYSMSCFLLSSRSFLFVAGNESARHSKSIWLEFLLANDSLVESVIRFISFINHFSFFFSLSFSGSTSISIEHRTMAKSSSSSISRHFNGKRTFFSACLFFDSRFHSSLNMIVLVSRCPIDTFWRTVHRRTALSSM